MPLSCMGKKIHILLNAIKRTIVLNDYEILSTYGRGKEMGATVRLFTFSCCNFSEEQVSKIKFRSPHLNEGLG